MHETWLSSELSGNSEVSDGDAVSVIESGMALPSASVVAQARRAYRQPSRHVVDLPCLVSVAALLLASPSVRGSRKDERGVCSKSADEALGWVWGQGALHLPCDWSRRRSACLKSMCHYGGELPVYVIGALRHRKRWNQKNRLVQLVEGWSELVQP